MRLGRQRRQHFWRNAQETQLIVDLFGIAFGQIVRHVQAQVHQCLAGRDDGHFGFFVRGVGIGHGDSRHAVAGRLQAPQRQVLGVALHDGLQQSAFGLADLHRIDHGQHVARANRVANLLEDDGHGAAGARRKMRDARGIEANLAVGHDRLGHGALLHDVHLDARLVGAFDRSELYATLVQRVAAVVFRPRDQRNRLRGVVLRQPRLAGALGKLRMADHALGHAVRGAEAEFLVAGHQIRLAFDA